LALSNARAGSINSLDEASLQAQVCKLKYAIVRDRLLTENVWGFSRRIRTLSVLTTEIFNWAYAYQYPSDCLKINRLVGAHEELANFDAEVIARLLDSQLLPLRGTRPQIEYEVFNFSGNKTLGANEANLRIDFTAKVTDPNLFTPDFILAFSHLLTSEIVIPIVGVKDGRSLRGDSLEIYRAYLNNAIADDVNEQYQEPALSEFETVRR